MAAPQAGGQRDGEHAAEAGLREVGDVVVLADDEALERARRRAIDLTVDLEDHGSLVERHVRIGVRQLDDT